MDLLRVSRVFLLTTIVSLGCGSDSDEPGKSPHQDAAIDSAVAEAGTDAGADVAVEASGADVAVEASGDVDVADTADGQAFSCASNVLFTVQTATVHDLHDAIGAGDELDVVDVREPTETAEGIIEGAVLKPWTSGKLEAGHDELNSGNPLYVICKSGGRSSLASAFLVENGHPCVVNVEGGMTAWQGAGYPTDKP